MARTGKVNEAWGNTDHAVAGLKAQLGAFCGACADISAKNPPPAMNAANGFFREAMFRGDELQALATASPDELALPDGKQLYDLLVLFGQSIKQAFSPENVSATGFTNIGLFIASADQLKTEIVPVVRDIVGLFTGNADSAKIINDVKLLIEKTKSLGVKLNGTHANGWIEPNVKSAAKAVKDRIVILQGSLADQAAKDFTRIIDKVCDKLIAIPDFDNKPWLVGEWQIEFEGIMRSVADSAKAELNP